MISSPTRVLLALAALFLAATGAAQTDYDDDNDNLIDVRSLAQLNAIRWDLDGDGTPLASATSSYAAAFPNPATGMGCQSTCAGYELRNDLDFDTDGDGVTHTNGNGDSGDDYYNGGSGWTAIGWTAATSTAYTARFDGNGHVIDNLFISGIRVNQGLFSRFGGGAVVTSLGLRNVRVSGGNQTAALVGYHRGHIGAVWSSGYVSGNDNVGGLVGWMAIPSYIVASYSTANVDCRSTASNAVGGGLLGFYLETRFSKVSASYSTGTVTGDCPAANRRGLIGFLNVLREGFVEASYWDANSSNIPDDTNSTPPEGKSTADLQGPTDYGADTDENAIYRTWDDRDVDKDGTIDPDPWDFGTSSDYPLLKFGGLDIYAQGRTVDYDDDDDNLIDIRTLAQLNAIRWDPDGNGSTNASYAAAFPGATSTMGCATTCIGYELRNDLDFDTDGDGATHTGGTGDPDDDYYNGGNGWDPIGDQQLAFNSSHFNRRLRGNGHVIRNLFINRSTESHVGLFAQLRENAVVTALGMPDAWVRGNGDVGVVAGTHRGDIGGVWTSGRVQAVSNAGGIVGKGETPAQPPLGSDMSEIKASYSTVAVHVTGTGGGQVGGGISAQTVQRLRTVYFAGTLTGTWRYGVQLGGTNHYHAAYWDTSLTSSSALGGGSGRTTSQLQMPTGYTGIYSSWNNEDVDFDGTTDPDPWHFGTSSQYPVLKFRGLDIYEQGRLFDYDDDDDNLIDIRTLAQLNAVRFDLDGDGVPTGGTSTFAAGYPFYRNGMGCPSTCAGYELRNDLDFDTDGDGSTHTGGTGDVHDDYYNGGSGWTPIGGIDTPGEETHFRAKFDGNGHVIDNLFVNHRRNYSGLFAAFSDAAEVTSLGLPNARVQNGLGTVGTLAGQNHGRIAAAWASGSVTATTNVGGLVGVQAASSTIVASYSTAAVNCTRSTGGAAGGLAAYNNASSTIEASYSTGAVTGTCTEKRGLTGNLGTVEASYWDVNLSGISTAADNSGSSPGEGKTTAELQTPTAYAGIYADWDDRDVDGDGATGDGDDADPWDFGSSNAYPILKYRDLAAAQQLDAQPNTAPAFAASLAAMTFPGNVAIESFQLPAVTGGNGAYDYTVAGLPAGISFDEDGTGDCGQAVTICGTPTAATSTTVMITVDDGDSNMDAGDRATLAFTVTVPAASARIVRTIPAALMETNLNDATVVVELSGSVFGASISPSSFQLVAVPAIAGLSIASATRTSDTQVTLTLRFDNTDFNTQSMLTVRVLAGSHRFGGDQDAAPVAVAPTSAMVLSKTTLALDEHPGSTNANVGTYTVVLTGQPATTATVTPTSGNVDVTTSGALTFNATNWDTAQTVTVTAGQDDDAVDDVAHIAHAVTGIPGVTSGPRVRVDVDDDDAPGLTLAATTLMAGVAEGASGTYTVVLDTQPTGPVTVAIASSDDAVAVDADATAGGDQNTLLFNVANWDTAQTVTVRASEDDDGESESVTLTHDPRGADYGEVADVDVSFTVTDNDTRGATLFDSAGVVMSGTYLVYEDSTRHYTLKLDTEPVGGNVAVAVASSATSTATVNPSSLTFTKANWDVPQAVTITGVADADTTDDDVTITHTPTGADYGSVSLGNLAARVMDSDVAGLTVAPGSLSVAEGATAAYAVRLNVAPTAAVTVTVTGTSTKLSVDQATLSFGTANWNTAQTVTVTGLADDDGEDEYVSLNHTVTGTGNYASLGILRRPGISVQVRDDERAGVVVSPLSLAIDEGGTATYEVRLSAPPASATATVSVAASGGADLTAASSTLEFGAANWDTARTVTVTAAADHARLEGAEALLTHAVTGYGAVTSGPDVRVTVRNTTVDYDPDADGLISVASLAQLNAMRWDLDGDGTASSGNETTYAAAFPNPRGASVCPTTTSGVACIGFELLNDLDFDTDGDGATHRNGAGDEDDDYYNGGAGWTPVGAFGSSFGGIFNGNGNIVRNLFVNDAATSYRGLFGYATGRLEAVGVANAWVRGGAGVGALSGSVTQATGSWSTGSVSGSTNVGGLVGETEQDGRIAASYSTAAVECRSAIGFTGGLLGGALYTAVTTSWSAGAVTGACPNKGGLLEGTNGEATASYWDARASGIADDADADSPEGRSTADLQRPTGYAGIYAAWNIDLDGDYEADDPWDFGSSSQYPSLKWRGFDPTEQFVGALSFASGVSNKSFVIGRPIAVFEVPAAVGGDGAVRYTARGLPPGLWFDADGRGQCGLPRSVCGAPTEAGSHTVSVTARDADGASAVLTFAVVVTDGEADEGPPAVLADEALRAAVALALDKAPGAVSEADLRALSSLNAAWSGVSSLEGLAKATNLRRLELGNNAVSDLSELSGLRLLEHLDLSGNAVEDLSALSGLTRLETLLLSDNRVSDLWPLRDLSALRELRLDGNAVEDLTPLTGLASLAELSLGGNPVGDLSPLCALTELTRLWLSGAGLSDISELSCLTALVRLDLSDNAVEDVSPLRGMRMLEWLNLERNAVSNVSPLRRLGALERLRLGSNRVESAAPLAENTGLGEGDVVGLRGNPLSRESIQSRVPQMRERGVAVLAGLSSPWFATAGDALGRSSFVRLVNRSDVAGEALLWGVDDAGERFGPARLAIGAGRTARVNSEDLERGNAAKGLSEGLGPPTSGGWRLEILSTLDLEAQTFLRSPSGPPTAAHDMLPREGGTLRAAFLPAGRESSPGGALRVSNPTGSDAAVYVWGVDDAGRGRLATGLVAPAGGVATVSSSELERWRMGSGRGLGRGAGNWRLKLTAPWPLEAQALAAGSGGGAGNLSTPGVSLSPGLVARVPLFPAASVDGRVGVARVSNLGAASGVVRVTAVDDAGVRVGPVSVELAAFETVEFDSRELEEGGRTLPEGVGSPTRGSWRLELRAEFGGAAYAYAAGTGGGAASLLDAAARSGGSAQVPVLNPGSNRTLRGLLRLVNDGAEDVSATIGGVDDAGRAGGTVRVSVPAGEALWLSAAELESGGADFTGSLGGGEGKWRLTVSSDAPLTVMSLVEDENGALGNLSTPGRR